MHAAVVRNIAVHGRYPANLIARTLLEEPGDSWVEYPLRDCLEEQGVTSMSGLEAGKNYYIETLTKYYCGELLHVDFSGLTLVKVAWIPDTGRYNEAFSSGQFNEVEPLPKDRKLFIPASVVSAVVEWNHALPLEVK